MENLNEYQEWSKYPALKSLFKMLDEAKLPNVHKRVGKFVSEYNGRMKYIDQMQADLTTKQYFACIVMKDYRDCRINRIASIEKHKSYLRNYIYARYRVLCEKLGVQA